MQIVIVGPVYPYRGGIAHHTALLARALAKRHRVQVISFKRQYPAFLYPGKTDKDPSSQGLQVEADFKLDALNPLTWIQTGREIARRKPDLVLFAWWVTFWAPGYAVIAAICRKHKIPVTFLIHNVLPHEGSRLHAPLARLALHFAKTCIVHSQREAGRLKKLLPGMQVCYTPFPAYDELASGPTIDRATARQNLRLAAEGSVLLFFGIVRPYKGLAILIEAVKILEDQGSPLELVVAGEIWGELEAYQQQIKQFGLENSVHLVNRYIPNEELPTYFAAADLAIAPYIDGTQSAAVSVIQGFGLPLVATEQALAGVPPEQRAAITIVPTGDAAALAQAIQQVLSSGQPGKNTTEKKFSGWEELVASVEEVLRKGRPA